MDIYPLLIDSDASDLDSEDEKRFAMDSDDENENCTHALQSVRVRCDGHYVVIRGLPRFCSDEDLHRICRGYGWIVLAKFTSSHKDKKRIGVVDFAEVECAKHAANALNGIWVYEHQIKAHYMTKKKRFGGPDSAELAQKFMVSLLRNTNNALYIVVVENLPPCFTKRQLFYLCAMQCKDSSQGDVVEQAMYRAGNEQTAFGVVAFDGRVGAEICVDNLNGTLFEGETLKAKLVCGNDVVTEALQTCPSYDDLPGIGCSYASLFNACARRRTEGVFNVVVSQLVRRVTYADLHILFCGCGFFGGTCANIVGMFIKRELFDVKTCQTSYAYVRFKTLKAARLAVRHLNNWPVHGQAIKVELQQETRKFHAKALEEVLPEETVNVDWRVLDERRRFAKRSGYTLFISNLPQTVSKQEVRELCTPFGKINYDGIRYGSSKEFRAGSTTCFVDFERWDSVYRAVGALDRKPFKNAVLRVNATKECDERVKDMRGKVPKVAEVIRECEEDRKRMLEQRNRLSLQEQELLWNLASQFQFYSMLFNGIQITDLIRNLMKMPGQTLPCKANDAMEKRKAETSRGITTQETLDLLDEMGFFNALHNDVWPEGVRKPELMDNEKQQKESSCSDGEDTDNEQDERNKEAYR